jgi:hypothetical protein
VAQAGRPASRAAATRMADGAGCPAAPRARRCRTPSASARWPAGAGPSRAAALPPRVHPGEAKQLHSAAQKRWGAGRRGQEHAGRSAHAWVLRSPVSSSPCSMKRRCRSRLVTHIATRQPSCVRSMRRRQAAQGAQPFVRGRASTESWPTTGAGPRVEEAGSSCGAQVTQQQRARSRTACMRRGSGSASRLREGRVG